MLFYNLSIGKNELKIKILKRTVVLLDYLLKPFRKIQMLKNKASMKYSELELDNISVKNGW